MTTNDFVLHPDQKPWGQRTDADVFGVRFPFRRELEFEDDTPFHFMDKPHFIIGEITQGECKLNGPWTERADKNMQYLLQAIGAFDPKELDAIADSLYETFHYDVPDFRVELIAFGRMSSSDFSDSDRPLMQLEFHELCRFIFRRFSQFKDIKNDHQHWDWAGQTLWKLSRDNWNSEDMFVEKALNAVGIRTLGS
ncbi:MAG TPA: hypothetical protein VGT08_11900 [Terracidiphilus sp.]|nr:hypothetical protein [Terracidiphilus sp.]